MSDKSKIAEKEEEILKFWQENKIFSKSLSQSKGKKEFVFYDGPPFATGLPHYGHLLPGTIKDIIPRYQTMKGKKVSRKWGWDCHGLPIENLVEKELGLSSKKDIEIFGVGKFNAAARGAVMRYADEWKKIIPRSGRFVDMENDYKTMDTNYTESVWWAFKNLYEKGLVYKSFKAMHLCPHCETTLSNFEVNQGYKDITDISVTIEFALVGEKDTYFLAWTTTPWTLPGNVALAVGPNIEYVCIEKKDEGVGKPIRFILAKEALSRVFKDDDYEIVKNYFGRDLIGKSYEPIFDYYANNSKLENRENGWKVYGADFVTTTDGTGIVHIAPAFGEDDMNLGLIEKLPFVQHVNIDGTFKKEVTDFVGQKVKPKDDHQKADVEILKYLDKKGILFEKEKYTHSYPHCWRCETPLLNYATTSWFIKVSEMKDKMVELNKNVSWVPGEIGEGRFGKWLLGARDWAISRSRYWGAPLPVWEDETKKLLVLGSIEDLKKYTKKSGNKYFVMRHGEAEQNLKDLINADPKNVFHLTEEGKKQVKIAAGDLKNKKIDLIISSPLARCKETAELVAGSLGLADSSLIFDDRLGELVAGDGFEGKTWAEYEKFFADRPTTFGEVPKGGETFENISKRVGEFIYDLEKQHKDKNILIVSHAMPIFTMHSMALGADIKQAREMKKSLVHHFKYAEFGELPFSPLPHDENYLLDLHRPFIDEVELVGENGNKLKRIPEVFDCWLESGSMSFAQYHYPFENKELFEEKNGSLFPADFIAEGLDQTRGWFYTLMVMGTGLFNQSPYKNVVVNGLVLAEDGRKMSKSLNNYPDPLVIMDKYGADSLRYYLASSSAVKAEDLNFSERGVDEVSKKIVLKLENVLSFFNLYTNKNIVANKISPKHILDLWIIGRLSELGTEITNSLDAYKIDSAARPIMDFVEDLSTWYIRRSRDRFKSEDIKDRNDALATTHFVLLNLAKYMAPFTPFFAESLYLNLKSESDPESVHLCEWPHFATPFAQGYGESKKISRGDDEIIKNMAEVRKIVSLALEKRMAAGIKVRQPLSKLEIRNSKFENKKEYLELIKDEVNVKNVEFDEKLEEEVELDTEITPELQKEGNLRDFVRAVQELRKEKKLLPTDEINLLVETDEIGKEFLNSVASEIKKPTNVSQIIFENNDGIELEIDDMVFKIRIK